MRPTLIAAFALLLLAAPALAAPTDASVGSPPPIVEVRDCDEFPNGREIYVLGIGLGCMGPAASQVIGPPPIVERRRCDGNGQDGVEYFVLGHSLGCIQP